MVERDADGHVVGVVEKPDDPPSTTVPRGLRVFSERIFDACRAVDRSATGEYELSQAVDALVRAGAAVELVAFEGWCVNLNTLADLKRARDRLTGDP